MITMDYHLIEQCRAGDTSAVEHFVQMYQQDIYRLAFSILDNSDEADEATQEALLAALRALDLFHGASSLKTWLFSITINICRTRLQHQKRRDLLKQTLNSIFQWKKFSRTKKLYPTRREFERSLLLVGRRTIDFLRCQTRGQKISNSI